MMKDTTDAAAPATGLSVAAATTITLYPPTNAVKAVESDAFAVVDNAQNSSTTATNSKGRSSDRGMPRRAKSFENHPRMNASGDVTTNVATKGTTTTNERVPRRLRRFVDRPQGRPTTMRAPPRRVKTERMSNPYQHKDAPTSLTRRKSLRRVKSMDAAASDDDCDEEEEAQGSIDPALLKILQDRANQNQNQGDETATNEEKAEPSVVARRPPCPFPGLSTSTIRTAATTQSATTESSGKPRLQQPENKDKEPKLPGAFPVQPTKRMQEEVTEAESDLLTSTQNSYHSSRSNRFHSSAASSCAQSTFSSWAQSSFDSLDSSYYSNSSDDDDDSRLGGKEEMMLPIAAEVVDDALGYEDMEAEIERRVEREVERRVSMDLARRTSIGTEEQHKPETAAVTTTAAAPLARVMRRSRNSIGAGVVVELPQQQTGITTTATPLTTTCTDAVLTEDQQEQEPLQEQEAAVVAEVSGMFSATATWRESNTAGSAAIQDRPSGRTPRRESEQIRRITTVLQRSGTASDGPEDLRALAMNIQAALQGASFYGRGRDPTRSSSSSSFKSKWKLLFGCFGTTSSTASQKKKQHEEPDELLEVTQELR